MIYPYPKVFWNFDTDQNCSELYIHVYIPELKSIYKILFYLEYICLYSLKSDTLNTLIFARKKFTLLSLSCELAISILATLVSLHYNI